jgi:hypothetical protein
MDLRGGYCHRATVIGLSLLGVVFWTSLKGRGRKATFERQYAIFERRKAKLHIRLTDFDIMYSRVLAFGVAMELGQQIGFNLPHSIDKFVLLGPYRRPQIPNCRVKLRLRNWFSVVHPLCPLL